MGYTGTCRWIGYGFWPLCPSLRSKCFGGVFRAPAPISEFRMRGKWGESKTNMRGGEGRREFVLLSPHFPRNQTSENAENPTETLATQATSALNRVYNFKRVCPGPVLDRVWLQYCRRVFGNSKSETFVCIYFSEQCFTSIKFPLKVHRC